MLKTRDRPDAILLPFGKRMQFYPPSVNSVLYLPGYPPQGSTIVDHSGQGNDGTITGATWAKDVRGLDYLDFDGSDDKVVIGSAATFKWLHGAEDTTDFKFTIKLWMFVASFADDLWGLVETGAGDSTQIGVSFWLDNRSGTATRRIKSLLSNGSGTAIVAPDAGNSSYPNDALWHHMVWTYNQTPATGNSVVYLDTTSKSADNKSAQTPSTSNPVQALTIGRVADTFTQYGGVALSEIIKDEAWTQAQVTANRNKERHLFGV